MENLTLFDRNPALRADVAWLMNNDPWFANRYETPDALNRNAGSDGFDGLVNIILGQQISTKAAAALRIKFEARFGTGNPATVIKAGEDDLRACGLSRQKIGYIRGLAQAFTDKTIDPARWPAESTETVIAEITALKGFGLWSAQMFLIFNLARPDVWPHGDLGIQRGYQFAASLPDKPTEAETLATGARFKGRETAAALMLWRIKDGGDSGLSS